MRHPNAPGDSLAKNAKASAIGARGRADNLFREVLQAKNHKSELVVYAPRVQRSCRSHRNRRRQHISASVYPSPHETLSTGIATGAKGDPLRRRGDGSCGPHADQRRTASGASTRRDPHCESADAEVGEATNWLATSGLNDLIAVRSTLPVTRIDGPQALGPIGILPSSRRPPIRSAAPRGLDS